MGLRNQLAREMGHPSFFALQVADYGMTVQGDDGPAGRHPGDHGAAVRPPALLGPAHPGRALQAAGAAGCCPRTGWATAGPRAGRGWSRPPAWTRRWRARTAQWVLGSRGAVLRVAGISAPARVVLAGRPTCCPCPPPAPRKKNAGASAWHIDGERDVRSLMSVEPNERWFGTAHHELGHIYYYLAYARPEVPLPAAHRGQPRLPRGGGRAGPPGQPAAAVSASAWAWCPPARQPDANAWLLSAAMDSIVFLAFAAGTMTHFEHDLYEAQLPAAEWQARWWQYSRPLPGRGAARPAPARAVRRLHQEPPQRRSRPVLRLRPGHPDQVPAARPHLPEDPQAGRARL